MLWIINKGGLTDEYEGKAQDPSPDREGEQGKAGEMEGGEKVMQFKYFRVRSYYQDGEWTGADHIYICSLPTEAIEAFRKEYPEHDRCIITAEEFDRERNEAVYQAFRESGCVHFW